jgi:hypothetical protein
MLTAGGCCGDALHKIVGHIRAFLSVSALAVTDSVSLCAQLSHAASPAQVLRLACESRLGGNQSAVTLEALMYDDAFVYSLVVCHCYSTHVDI